jgi:hypothetical protein
MSRYIHISEEYYESEGVHDIRWFYRLLRSKAALGIGVARLEVRTLTLEGKSETLIKVAFVLNYVRISYKLELGRGLL